MVSFSCEVCNDTVIKKKLDQHRQRCYDAYFTCIDCSTTFSGTDYKNHTQCISEAEKYEKSLYKGKPTKQANKATPAPVKQTKQEKQTRETKQPKQPKQVENKDEEKSAKSAEKNSSKTSSAKASKKEKKTAENSSVDLSKYGGGSLGKVLKSISKDTKTDKKELMKKMRLELVDGKLVLTL